MMWIHLLIVCLVAELYSAERQLPLKTNTAHDGDSDGRGTGGWASVGGSGGWDSDSGFSGGWDSDSGSSGGWDSDSGSSGGWDSDSGSSGGWDSDSGSSGGWDSDSGSSGGWDSHSDSSGDWDSDSGSSGGWDSDSGSSGGWDSDSGSSGGWDSDSGSSGGWDSDSDSSGGWDSDGDSSGGWDSDSGSGSGSGGSGNGNEDDEGNGDPHFIVTSHDEYQTKLCYDVNGNDRDVLVILRDEEHKLEINGEIYQRRNMKHPQAFFNNIAVLYGDVKVVASLSNITINDQDRFTWIDSFTAPLSDVVEASVSSGRVPVVEIDLSSDIQLEITRTKTDEGDYFLGIMVTNSNGLSEITTGVIGDFLKSSFKAVTLDNSDNFVEFLDRSLTVPVQKVTRYSRVNQGQIDCWHYTVNTREMQDDLLGDRESYTVPTLTYKPF